MARWVVFTLAVCGGWTIAIAAQAPAGAPPAVTPATGSSYQRFAPIDLTGTWVSLITEDWAVRMIAPPKGDFESLPLTRAAQDAANQANMAQVDAAGRACEAYGAPALLRQPGRVRITWEDGDTLRLAMDAGGQSRLLHFDPAAPRGAASAQGFSRAEWHYANGFDPVRAAQAPPPLAPGAVPARGRGRGAAGVTVPMGGRLKVVTTNLAPGFLRKNGVPYSSNAILTENFNELTEPDGTRWFVVTTIIHDPENLAVDYITSSNFRREPDDSKWKATPCSLR